MTVGFPLLAKQPRLTSTTQTQTAGLNHGHVQWYYCVPSAVLVVWTIYSTVYRLQTGRVDSLQYSTVYSQHAMIMVVYMVYSTVLYTVNSTGSAVCLQYSTVYSQQYRLQYSTVPAQTGYSVNRGIL